MSADVIQQRAARRKRAGAWSWTTRHVVLLAVAIIAILVASWLAPDLATPPAPTPVQHHVATPEPVAQDQPIVDIFTDLAIPPAPQRIRPTARQTGVPLDAVVEPRDDYEILSASELAAISQARD